MIHASYYNKVERIHNDSIANKDERVLQALRAEQFLLNLCYEDYGEIQLTPHMCNLVVDVWCRVENMRRAELLVKKMDEQVIINYDCEIRI